MAEVLFSSHQWFRLWSYRVSHCELIMRSWRKDGEEPLELFFDAVDSIDLSTRGYKPVEIRRLADVQLDGREGSAFRRMTLQVVGPAHTGTLVCGGFEVWSGEYSTGTKLFGMNMAGRSALPSTEGP